MGASEEVGGPRCHSRSQLLIEHGPRCMVKVLLPRTPYADTPVNVVVTFLSICYHNRENVDGIRADQPDGLQSPRGHRFSLFDRLL